MKQIFTSESVTEGHPDKMADQISDAVLDSLLRDDPYSRVACETMLSRGLCLVTGEIKTDAYVDLQGIVRKTICDIGYDDQVKGYDGNTCGVMVSISEQSEEIADGVDNSLEQREGTSKSISDGQGAGDQGMMFGYACRDTESLMPFPIDLAHRLASRLAEVRKTGVIPFLYPDGKTQVSIEYENGKPVGIDTILISAQHRHGIDINGDLKPELVEYVIDPVLSNGLTDMPCDNIIVNPAGSFVSGGPMADSGLTGRKIIVDTYGGMARHGGGAFSGKDPSKVDRSASYAARWIAKNIVASGAADRCEVQIAYAIGQANPVSFMVETFGTEQTSPEKIVEAAKEVFDMRPAAIIAELDLLQPVYKSTAAYGHFGREDFTWEAIDKAEELARCM